MHALSMLVLYNANSRTMIISAELELPVDWNMQQCIHKTVEADVSLITNNLVEQHIHTLNKIDYCIYIMENIILCHIDITLEINQWACRVAKLIKEDWPIVLQ